MNLCCFVSHLPAAASRVSLVVAGLLWLAPLALAAAPDEARSSSSRIHPRLAAELDAGQDTGKLPGTHYVIVLVEPDRLAAEADRTAAYATESGRDAVRADVERSRSRVLAARRHGTLALRYSYSHLYGFSADADADAIAELAELDGVVSIEPVPRYELHNAEAHPLTQTDAVHNLGFTGDGVTVAVVDIAVDHDHDAFGGDPSYPNAKVVGGHDFADDDPDPTLDCDTQKHGTSVSALAVGTGGAGVTGTAPGAGLVFLKLNPAASCAINGFSEDINRAVDWVVANRQAFNIRVLSLSLGFGRFDNQAQCDAFSPIVNASLSAAHAAGVAIFASSGNDGYCDGIAHPACTSWTVSVGAVYDADIGPRSWCISSDSCRGANDPGLGCWACEDDPTAADGIGCFGSTGALLDLFAPTRCATTADASLTSTNGLRNCFGGTSAAAPFAAGVGALLFEADPDLTPDGVKAAMVAGGVGLFDSRSGRTIPRVDALGALQLAGLIFADGFEAGNTSAWSGSAP